MPVWMFALADYNGVTLADITHAAGKRLTFTRNGVPEFVCTFSHEDTAATKLLTALDVATPTVRAYRDGVLRFAGYLAPFIETLEEATQVNLVVRGPFARLLGDGQARGRFTSASRVFAATDAGQIAKTLIDEANVQGPTGIATTGTVEATKLRDRTYERANIGEAIIALTRVQDGFDFEVAPAEGSVPGVFNVYGSQGMDQPLAVFEYGPDTVGNVRAVTRQTQPPINHVTVLGANGLIGTAEDAPSIGTRGLWPTQIAATDVSEQVTLDDKARALLRPEPVRTVSFTPDSALAPRPWDDFWLGDTIRFRGRRSAFLQEATVRVNQITVLIDDEGNETYELPDPSGDGQLVGGVSVEIV